MQISSKKISNAIVKVNDYLILLLVGIFLIIVSISWDIYDNKKNIENEKKANLELATNEIERIVKGHEKFLAEISKELSRKETVTDDQRLQILRESYITIKGLDNRWVNLVWKEDKKINREITQLGIKVINSEKRDLSKGNELRICKSVVREGRKIIGEICLEQSLENIEQILNQKTDKKVIITNSAIIGENYRDERLKNYYTKDVYISVYSTQPGNINFYNITYIVLTMSIATIIVFNTNRKKKKQEFLYERKIKGHKSKVRSLEGILAKDSLYKKQGYLRKEDMLNLIYYFHKEFTELDLNIELKINDETTNKKFNTEALYKILMSLLLESVNRIDRQGNILLKFKVKNQEMIEMYYTDNLHYVEIKEEEDIIKQKIRQHFFYLDKVSIKKLLDQNNGIYEENEILYKRKEIRIKLPIIKNQLSDNIISIKSFIKSSNDEV